MANAKRKLEVVITGDSRGLERAFGRSAKASDSFGRRVSKGAGKGLLLLGGGVAAAAVAGVAGVSIGLIKSAKAAAEAEASNARLSAQLRTLGKDNAQVKGNIDKTVQSLSMLSGFDDEELQDAFTTLVRSSGNVAKSQRDIALAADMAASGTMNLTTASKLINRVNNGSVTALKRYGIAVDENTTKEQAIAMLRKKFAGQAEAYGKTAAGAQARFGVALENTFEQIGVALTPLIVEFSNVATKYLPGIAKAVSAHLGQAISWLKQNWPQIKAVLVGVFEAFRTYYTTIVIPVAKGIITALGAVVGFVRDNWPQIKATAQAVFGWIQTNIIPTIQGVARAIATIVRGMTTIWREHGEDIKRIVGPIFNTLKTVIKSALIIIREVVELSLAMIRGDWSEVWSSLKTIVKTVFTALAAIALTGLRTMKAIVGILGREIVEYLAEKLGALREKVREKFDAAKTAITNAKDRLVETAKMLGGDIVRGIADGITSLPTLIKDKLVGLVTNAFDAAKAKAKINSPSLLAKSEIGQPIVRGIAAGIAQDSKIVAKELSATVRDAVYSARSNLSGLTSGLAGMLGSIFASNSTESKRLREIRAEQNATRRIREKSELEAAIASAETDDDKRKAQQDLDDWLLDDEAARLEESIAAQQESYETNIANLTASFNKGAISAEEFRAQLNALIGGDTGASMGEAFATEFSLQLAAVFEQISRLAGISVGAGGPGVSDPQATYGEELKEWQKARAARLEELKEPFQKKDSDGGKTITQGEWRKISAALSRWDTNHPKPKPLAMGGILRRQVFTAGEAGPEAVLPLSSGRAQKMLASAIDGADRMSGRGATTIVVNVSGNEFSARDFARKLKPELERIVGFGTV